VATLIVAGLSARTMAEAASREGWNVIALDAFGDTDTRRCAAAWHAIGQPDGTGVSLERTRQALAHHAGDADVIGWVAGSGFEGLSRWLVDTPLPLIGTPPAALQRLRDPLCWFTALHDLTLPHPDSSPHPPTQPRGWLCKSLHACGGSHVRPATVQDTPAPGRYWQRWHPGQPMSTLFLAHAEGTVCLGHNVQDNRPGQLGEAPCPWLYQGAIGPVSLPTRVDHALRQATQALRHHFGLRGLCSLDFLLDGESICLLEVNARPTATWPLYAEAGPLMTAHVAASLGQPLPPLQTPRIPAGLTTLFTSRPLHISSAVHEVLVQRPWVHDIPEPGTRLPAHMPLCTLSAQGGHPTEVRARLSARRDTLQRHLATLPSTGPIHVSHAPHT
jgi:predicted ATP-grasp superfamily ATP-dependent carboligase